MVYLLSSPGAWPGGWPVTADQVDEIEKRRWKKGKRQRKENTGAQNGHREIQQREKTESAKDREARRKKRNEVEIERENG